MKCPLCAVLGGAAIVLLVIVAIYTQLPPEQGVLSYAELAEQLKTHNISVVEGGKAGPDDMLRGEKSILYVNDELMQVWEYRTEKAALKDKSNIGPDGSHVQLGWGSSAIYDWVAPPHFYQKGRIIVLYNGDNEETMTALEAILGQQFAGS